MAYRRRLILAAVILIAAWNLFRAVLLLEEATTSSNILSKASEASSNILSEASEYFTVFFPHEHTSVEMSSLQNLLWSVGDSLNWNMLDTNIPKVFQDFLEMPMGNTLVFCSSHCMDLS